MDGPEDDDRDERRRRMRRARFGAAAARRGGEDPQDRDEGGALDPREPRRGRGRQDPAEDPRAGPFSEPEDPGREEGAIEALRRLREGLSKGFEGSGPQPRRQASLGSLRRARDGALFDRETAERRGGVRRDAAGEPRSFRDRGEPDADARVPLDGDADTPGSGIGRWVRGSAAYDAADQDGGYDPEAYGRSLDQARVPPDDPGGGGYEETRRMSSGRRRGRGGFDAADYEGQGVDDAPDPRRGGGSFEDPLDADPRLTGYRDDAAGRRPARSGERGRRSRDDFAEAGYGASEGYDDDPLAGGDYDRAETRGRRGRRRGAERDPNADGYAAPEERRGRSGGARRGAAAMFEDPASGDPFGDDSFAAELTGRRARGKRGGKAGAAKQAPAVDMSFRPGGAFSSLERMLAGRYLRARRQEGFISVISILSLVGITLGVAVLIIVMSVMNGFRAELVDKITGADAHITVQPGYTTGLQDYDGLAERIDDIIEVELAAPTVESQAFVTSQTSGFGAVVNGMRREDLLRVDGVGRIRDGADDAYPIGDLDSFNSGDGVAIGWALAERLRVTIGDKISVISPRGRATPVGNLPKRQVFTVEYIFKIGMYAYDASRIYMSLSEAQRLFNRVDDRGNPVVDAIDVRVIDPENLTGVRADIAEIAGVGARIGDWQFANSQFIGALKTERTVMFLILTLLILIASLIIISGMIMLVKEKTKDIAILRTMGLGRGAVLRIFFMCGATIGVVGTVFGVILGVLITLNLRSIKAGVEALTGSDVFPETVYIFNELPTRLDQGDVLMTAGIALGLSFVATLYPAWRAAKLDPVEALRYE